MRLGIRYLIDRLAGPRTRAQELYQLRRRLVAQAQPRRVSGEEQRAAAELRRLRAELATRLGEVASCRGCVRPPSVGWPGGHCCSGATEALFTDPELAALACSGTTPADLTGPRSAHRGCCFRGPAGCSLEPADRPTLCVRYTCPELERELERRGDVHELRRLQERLRVEFERFATLRSARFEDEQWAELEASFEPRPPPRGVTEPHDPSRTAAHSFDGQGVRASGWWGEASDRRPRTSRS
jgi:hypothetical protein